MRRNKKTDCEILGDDFENVFTGIGDCFETAFDEKKTKKNIVGSIFNLGKSVTKLGWNLGTCAVKNTPKAITTIAAAKRELVQGIESGVNDYQKQVKKDALDEKIKHLQKKKYLKS